MFERYTDKARRAVFFARYEAGEFGSPEIETGHLLLGLLREDKPLVNRFLSSRAEIESIRADIEQQTSRGEKAPAEADLPLSPECLRALVHAAEEADRLGRRQIGTEHLLLALLHEDTGFAALLLRERGLELNRVRDQIAWGLDEGSAPDADAGGS